MPYILAWLVGDIAFSFVKKGVYIALITAFLIAVIGMWGSFVVMFFYFFNIMQDFLNALGGSGLGGSGVYVSKFFGLLNCIGFIDAFNNTKAVWLSSITFLFSRILFGMTIRAYSLFLSALTPLLTR